MTTARSLSSADTNVAGDMQTSSAEALAISGMPRTTSTAKTLEICSFIAAAALAAFYLATSLYIASHRLLWFDELFTVHIARQPAWVMIWTALGHAADSLPAIYYMTVRLFDNLFGPNEVSARLPSALAFVTGLLITFDCARRHTDGLHGLIALSVLTCSFLPYYGYEARSYAIYFMFAALSLWIWSCTGTDNKLAAILFGAVLCLGVTFHYYAVLLLVPYGLWELHRWKPWQMPSPKLIAGAIGVIVPVSALSGLILPYARQFSPGFWAHPTFHELRATFSVFFPDGLFLLALIMVWAVFVATKIKRPFYLQLMQPAEAVGWLFLCIPLAGFVLAKWKTNAFIPRYFIGALPGIAVAFSCLLWRHFRHAYRASLGVFLILATWGAAKQVDTAQHPELVDPGWGDQTRARAVLSLEDPLRNDGKQFIVFSGGTLYLEAQYYSKRPKQCAFLIDSVDLRGFSKTGLTLNLAHYYPMQLWNLDDLKQHALETALIEPAPETLDAMRQAGFKVVVRFSKPLEVAYLQ